MCLQILFAMLALTWAAAVGLGLLVGFGAYWLVIGVFSLSRTNRAEPAQPRPMSGQIKALATIVGVVAGVGCARVLWLLVVPG
jgi:hypothetical protein